MTERTVLVVEDDDDIREITQLAMELAGGWSALAASSGPDGLDLARSHRPDVILLDVMMPGMDGPTTFGHLREDPVTQDIPVILLTAKVLVGERQVWDDLAVAGVIRTPYNPTTRATAVDEVLAATA
jgi:CheY-like chemotaxis protein